MTPPPSYRPDFVPFSESLVVKHAGHGAALAWHQEGSAHWADGPAAEHGFNFMASRLGGGGAGILLCDALRCRSEGYSPDKPELGQA